MKDLPNLFESHHAKYLEDEVEKLKVKAFNAKLKDWEFTHDWELFVELVGRLRKEGEVQIECTPSNMSQENSNYIAIFDHQIIVGKFSSMDDKV